jgi:hypothetical protein
MSGGNMNWTPEQWEAHRNQAYTAAGLTPEQINPPPRAPTPSGMRGPSTVPMENARGNFEARDATPEEIARMPQQQPIRGVADHAGRALPSMPTRPGPGVTQEQWARSQQPGADPRFGGGAGGWATTGQTRSGELASVQGRGMGQQLGQAMQAMPKPQPRGAAPGGQMQMQPQAPAPMPQQAPQQQPMAPTENVQAASPGGVGSYNTSYQQALQAKGRGFQQDDATVQANFDRLMKEDPFTARQYANQNPAWYQRNQMQIKDQHFGGDAAKRNAWTNTNTAGGYSNRNINNADVQRRLMSTLPQG